jgi:putative ABC transport system substrate-binding protein
MTPLRLSLALFVALLTVLLPGAAQESRKAMPRIGVLWPNPPQMFEPFRQGLKDLGYVEGRNIAFEYRWAENKLDQLAEMASELVQLKVDVIVCLAPPAAFAAKRATQSIPVVFVAIGDPLANGLVASLAHPGGNLTGTTRMLSEMSAKNLALLKEAIPTLARVAVLWNPANSSHVTALKELDATARSLSLQLRPMEVRSPAEFDGVFAAISKQRPDGVLLLADPLFFIHLKSLMGLAAANRLPTASSWTELPDAGGLLGYATSLPAEYRQAAGYVDKILKGARPGDLPVQQPTKFELVVNLKTARALGLTIPREFLLRADRAIE